MLSIFNFLPWLGCVFVTISICLECLWKVPGRLDPDAFKKRKGESGCPCLSAQVSASFFSLLWLKSCYSWKVGSSLQQEMRVQYTYIRICLAISV